MRIVSLLASATEVLFALGLGEQVLAVSHECDFPAEARQRPQATRSRIDSRQTSGQIDLQVRSLLERGEPLYTIDRELMLSLRPDLIVTQAQCDVCAVRYADVLDLVAAESSLAHCQVLALQPSSLADIVADVERIGQATGADRVAAAYRELLQVRIDRVRQKGEAAATSRRPTVVILEWLDPLMTAGNWTPELVALAGGVELLAEAGKHSGYISWDAVRAADPDVLIVAPCGFDLEITLDESKRLIELPGWQQLSAVRNSRVYALDGNAYLNRSGPRIVETLEILAQSMGALTKSALKNGDYFRLHKACGSPPKEG